MNPKIEKQMEGNMEHVETVRERTHDWEGGFGVCNTHILHRYLGSSACSKIDTPSALQPLLRLACWLVWGSIRVV